MQYIPDKEINLEERDLLGTLVYVDSILDSIKICETPFTIGIFGGWGSGKSSIIKTLEEKIKSKKRSNLEIMSYDAWKYSNDSFRRTFLLEIKEKLDLKPKQDLVDRFYKEEWEDTNFEQKLTKMGLVKSGYFLITVIIIAILWIFTYEQPGLAAILTAITLINSLLIFFIRDVLVTYRTTQISPRTFAPEQFEEIFNEMVDELTEQKISNRGWIEEKKRKHKVEKIIFVIDNLDRCGKETAIELMLTIKNFLEKRNNEDIDYVDGKEFLRKFFNTTLRIKEFTDLELFDFAVILNKSYNLEFSNSILHLAAREFAQNPRRVIQFLNNLQTERNWYEKAEEMGNISKDSVLTNLEFLAKILIIREEWPDLFNRISKKPRLLQVIDNLVVEEYSKNNELELSKKQFEFFKRTKTFTSEIKEIYFLTKDNLKDLPDILPNLIDNYDWEGIKELLETQLNFNKLFDYIFERFQREVVQDQLIYTTGFSILSLVLEIFFDDVFSEILKKRTKEVLIFFEEPYLKPIVENLNTRKLIEFSKFHYDQQQFSIANTILKSINSYSKDNLGDQGKVNLISNMVLRFFTEEVILDEIKDIFQLLITENPSILSEFISIFEYPEKLVPLLGNDFVNFLINSISGNYNQNNNNHKVKFLKAMLYTNDYSDGIFNLIQRISQYANVNNVSAISDWLNVIEPFLNSKESRVFPIIFPVLRERNGFLTQIVNKVDILENELDAINAFVNTCITLYRHYTPNRPQIGSYIQSFYVEKNSKLIDTISDFYKEFVLVNSDYDENLISRMLTKMEEFLEPSNKDKAFSVIRNILSNPNIEDILNLNTIKTIFARLMTFYLSTNETLLDCSRDWFKDLIKYEHLIGYIKQIITENRNVENATKILELVGSFKEDDFKIEIVKEIIDETDEKDEITEIFRILNESKNQNQSAIRKIVMDYISIISLDDIHFYKIILENSIKYIQLFNLKEKGSIARKLLILLESNLDDQRFALELLYQIDRLPKKSIERLCTSLEEIINFKEKKDKSLLNKVKKKFCSE